MSYINCGYVEKLHPWCTLKEMTEAGDKLFEGKTLEEMRAIPAEEFIKMAYPLQNVRRWICT